MSKAKSVCYKPTPIGERFGRLVVIGDGGWYESPSGKSRARLVRCKCDCGKEITVRLPYLKNGKTTSCGCYKIDKFVGINRKYNQFDIQDDVCVGYCENGTRFIFDIQDYDTVKNLYWNVTSDGYIATHSINKNKRISLHRFLTNAPQDKFVDHINGDKLDNRRNNLRICTPSQNCMNRHNSITNKCGKIGITYRAYKDRYEAYIFVNKKNIYLGCYKNLQDAINARVEAELKYYGEFAASANVIQ